MSNQIVLTAKEATEQLGCSRRTITNYVNSGKIKKAGYVVIDGTTQLLILINKGVFKKVDKIIGGM